MSFPRTCSEAKAQGYTLTNLALCRLCEREIEWWMTPQKKKAPIDSTIDPEGFTSHFATCPVYRKRKEP